MGLEGTEQLTQEIKALGKTISETLEKQGEEIKAHGQTSKDTAKKMGDLEAKYDALLADLEAEKKAAREFEAKMGRLGLGAPGEEKSVGRRFVESEEFKNYGSKGNRAKLEVKALSMSNIGNAVLVRPDRVPGIIGPNTRQPTIRDLIAQGTTTSNAIEFVQETAFFVVAAEVATASIAGATTLVLSSVEGLFVGQSVVIGATGPTGARLATAEARAITAINIGTKTITVAAMTNAHAVGELVGSAQISGTAEEAQKPQGAWRAELVTVPVRTLAFFIRASKQILNDTAQLESMIDARMEVGLSIVEDFQILNGSGTGQDLTGLMVSARAFNRTTGPTQLDTIRRAYTQVRLSEYTADGLVLNPVDWEAIELLKGTDNKYVWVNVNDGGVARLWRMRVVETTAIPQGKFLAGAFELGAQVFDRQDATVEVFEQDVDNVQKNMVTIRAEERLALATYRPDAFVQGTL